MDMHFFDYELPEKLIAQNAVEPRDSARLLVLRRDTQSLEHRVFRDLPDLLSPGDLLVVNDTKVLPARVVGQREKTSGKWEALYLHQHSDGLWEMLAQTRGYAEEGETFLTETGLRLTLVGRTESRHWLMRPEEEGTPAELLIKFGQIPLPPYIRKGRAAATDEERYQTVYAAQTGSVAAPTAGLHFTPELLQRLASQGIAQARVTLHVGLGTFEAVKTEDPLLHKIHAEWCEVSEQTVQAINEAKARKGRVIAVGTTTTRTLESAAIENGMQPYRAETGLYIHPPFEFRVLDGLITNFHLPKTTLLLLVQAFSGTDLLRRAYEEAIREEYRFYSYGDAMLIL
jgi:S-adenosylmethionine:tRNA ribosyltransferase-isomerase